MRDTNLTDGDKKEMRTLAGSLVKKLPFTAPEALLEKVTGYLENAFHRGLDAAKTRAVPSVSDGGAGSDKERTTLGENVIADFKAQRALPARLDADRTAKPLTTIAEVFDEGDGKLRTLFEGAGKEYVVHQRTSEASPTDSLQASGEAAWDAFKSMAPTRTNEASLVRCWRCKHDVPEETTVCNAGIGTQCKDAKACRGRWYGPHRTDKADPPGSWAKADDYGPTSLYAMALRWNDAHGKSRTPGEVEGLARVLSEAYAMGVAAPRAETAVPLKDGEVGRWFHRGYLAAIEAAVKLCEEETRICKRQKEQVPSRDRSLHMGGECIARTLAHRIEGLTPDEKGEVGR